MSAPHLGPGHSVAGKYTIRALLGFTGEVATYHAVSNDGREVVLRLNDPAIGQRADVMAQLDRVRQQVAQLPPGGVAATIDAGYDVGTGAPFSVTEYVQLPSLSRLIETGPLSPEVVALLLRSLSSVLDAAHSLGLHHLALKPTNIFVGPAPHYQVRVTDFDASIIRRTSPATHDVYSLSAPWWAPEQLQPAAVLGPPADVFATALIAFFALSARSYWISCQTQPPDLPAWQLELMGQRLPVSQRARELGAVINPLFDGVFGRALSVNQPDRPQSSMEIANVLAAASGADDPAPKTLAFPEAQAGDFTPPPPFGSGAPNHGAPNNGATDQGGYVATAASGAGAPTGQDSHEQVLAPGLPPFPQPVRRKSSSAMLPIIIGVIAAVLIGGGGVAFLFMRKPGGETSVAAMGSGSAESSAAGADTPPPAPTAPKDPKPSEPVPAPNTSASAAPADDVVSALFRCEPKCERIEIDGKALEKPEEKVDLKPGKYKVRLVRVGYLIQEDTIVVEAGKPFDKVYRLIRLNARPKPNNCAGQFLCP